MCEIQALHRITRSVVPALIGVVAVGCAPGLHELRLRTADREVRTAPRPRRPLALPDEQVQQAIRVLARKVVPCADPLEFARQRLDMPVRGGVYVFNSRTKQIRPVDAAAAAAEALPPELVTQARDYLGWCGSIHKQGDCLQVLRNGGILDAHGRYAVAMASAQGSTIEATGASLKGMVNPDAVMAMLVSGMTMYMMLWVLPEPVSKGIAAVMTAVLVVYLGVDTLYTLGWGWKALVDAADKATTFEDLRKAGEEFGKVMGADTARILVMLATATMGSEANLAEIAPTLPGAAQASRLAVAEGGVALEAVGAVETVTIAESGLTIALAPGAVAMSSTSGDFGRGRVHVSRPTETRGGTQRPPSSAPTAAPQGARSAPVERTVAGERFVRVGAGPENLKWTMEHPGGVAPGTYAVPESVFNEIGPDPARLKDLLDLPGEPPTVFRVFEPPPGTPIQRGVVPGGEFGGRGGLPEVYFPEGF